MMSKINISTRGMNSGMPSSSSSSPLFFRLIRLLTFTLLALSCQVTTSLSSTQFKYLVNIPPSSVEFSPPDNAHNRLQVSKNANQNDDKTKLFQSNRRNILHQCIKASLSTIVLSTTSCCTTTQKSIAATPLTSEEADNSQARFERMFRNKPKKILRPNLNLDFAVLLMRSSYNAMDLIDCVAMDQFQRDFFLIRQAEYLPYIQNIGPGLVQQGNLIDPYYFDFISFAQYATINREITIDPPYVFEELAPIQENNEERTQQQQQPQQLQQTPTSDNNKTNDGDKVEEQRFEKRIVRRDASILNNSQLAAKHDEIVGNTILDKLNDTFENTPSAIPRLNNEFSVDDDVTMIQNSIQQIVNLFLINGFAFDGNVQVQKTSNNGSTTKQIQITLNSPATLWSGEALQFRGGKVLNDFVSKTTRALLVRANYKILSSSVKCEGNKEISTIVIQ